MIDLKPSSDSQGIMMSVQKHNGQSAITNSMPEDRSSAVRFARAQTDRGHHRRPNQKTKHGTYDDTEASAAKKKSP